MAVKSGNPEYKQGSDPATVYRQIVAEKIKAGKPLTEAERQQLWIELVVKNSSQDNKR